MQRSPDKRRAVVARCSAPMRASVSGRAGVATRPRNSSSSARVGMAGVQPWRVTTMRAGRIAAPAAVRGGQALDPAAQVAGQEGVAGAEDVQHLDRESADDEALLDARRDRPLEDDAAGDAALHHDGRAGAGADRAQRLERARPAAGDADLLLGADDEVAVGQEFLHLPRDVGRATLALGAAAVAGEAPEHRPVVDVEHDLEPVLFRERDGATRRRAHAVGGKMRAGDRERLGRGERSRVDVAGSSPMSAQFSR